MIVASSGIDEVSISVVTDYRSHCRDRRSIHIPASRWRLRRADHGVGALSNPVAEASFDKPPDRRARDLSGSMDEQVSEEWPLSETVRHLVMAADAAMLKTSP